MAVNEGQVTRADQSEEEKAWNSSKSDRIMRERVKRVLQECDRSDVDWFFAQQITSGHTAAIYSASLSEEQRAI